MVIDLAVQLQGKVKDNTPVKTGHLRNEWHVGSIEKRGNEYYIEVYNNVEYSGEIQGRCKSSNRSCRRCCGINDEMPERVAL